MKGVYFALELLQAQNRAIAKKQAAPAVSVKGKRVLVIGGGDTGSDCVGTSIRQGAASVTQIEIMPMPPEKYNPETPWPAYPRILKTTSSHEEGCTRRWNLESKRFVGKDGKLTGVEVETVEWKTDETGRMSMVRTGKIETIKAEAVLLAMGFVHPVLKGLIESLNPTLDKRQNVASNIDGSTSVPKVFAAGDVTNGASLVIRAIASGRKAAAGIDKYLNS